MLVRICSTDSGTGEEDVFDVEIPVLDSESVSVALDQHLAPADPGFPQLGAHAEEHFYRAPDERKAAFIYTYEDQYFGHVLVTGIVYTEFA